MRIPKALLFSINIALIVIFSALVAVAQQYDIVRADYGYRNQRVDVTQQLRDVARTNSTFRMGNSTFGVDPSPGHVKSLRIFARDQRGRERMFEYREGSTVDGSLFSGWGRDFGGRDGWDRDGDSGQYTILHAEYGTERNHVDVTRRLRELAREDIRFRMGNSTFDIDPDPGRVKTLRIYARGPGGERMFEYREGSTVDGSQFRGWRGGDWGHDGWGGNWGGGGGGGGDRDGDSGQYVILRAEYGTERRHVDVTNRLRELARADVRFRMGNSTFDTDPDPGHVKTLRIFARGPGGSERVFEYREGSTVDGSQFKGWGRGDWGR
ncbi:MAG TPA: hypothetical protein VGF08_14365 [Terriglobales bacterium]